MTDSKVKTIYTNGKIYTVAGDDWEKHPQEAMAVASDGTILFVGANEEALAFEDGLPRYARNDNSVIASVARQSTGVLDLGGRTVFPGFVDTHVHLPGISVTELYEINLYGLRYKDETLAKIREYTQTHPDDEIYIGHGFSLGIATDSRGPLKEWLDEIVSDRPMVLNSHDGHTVWMNSKAFEVFGIDEETELPVGGCMKKDELTGEPLGTLSDCFDLIVNHPTLTEEQKRATIGHFQHQMLGWGYTSAMLIAPNFVEIEYLKDFEQTGELVMRFNLSHEVFEKEDFDGAVSAIDKYNKMFSDNEKVKATTVKFFADGVVEGLTAFLFEPYLGFEDNPCGLKSGHRSELLWDEKDFAECFDAAVRKGLQIHVHSIGDAATAATVSAMRYAAEKNPDADPRNTITHLQLIRPEEIKAIAELGIIASNQPFWHAKEPDWYVCVEEFPLGEERAESAYPLKTCLDAGVILTFSGDFPVAHVNNPFFAIETAVTRNLANEASYGYPKLSTMDDPLWLRNPAERIPLKSAIEAYTINGAYQLFREDEIGSLEVGKKADFIVLDRNPFDLNPIDISDTEVLMTVIDGQTVLDKEGI
ncbi:MAG: amidohydrolase [Clostridiales Family XIII bacterium]|jgi:predicted amidohydrolase YtcJ|nr:amidohydrolase [Clostridiales Family XIII bacterium]